MTIRAAIASLKSSAALTPLYEKRSRKWTVAVGAGDRTLGRLALWMEIYNLHGAAAHAPSARTPGAEVARGPEVDDERPGKTESRANKQTEILLVAAAAAPRSQPNNGRRPGKLLPSPK